MQPGAEQSFFLKKEPKTFSDLGERALVPLKPTPQIEKVILLLFLQKKKCFHWS
jgi:hypothetical protein